MKNNFSVVYVNYSPYENSGHILEYLMDNFRYVFLFSLAFHKVKSKRQTNKLSIYKDGKLYKEEFLFYWNIPVSLALFLIPLRSSINLFQIVKKIIFLKIKYKNIDIFFTVNAFTASIGRILKYLRIVNKSIFWVWDYYPINHEKITFRILRYLYWQFDKFATYSDKVIYLNKRLADVRKKEGIISKESKIISVPIGTGKSLPLKKKNLNKIRIGFIGVLKKSQGIDMLLTAANLLEKSYSNLSFEIIGSGPDAEEFKSKAPKKLNVKYNFYGYLDDFKAGEILYNCTLGIAPYSSENASVSKFADPGKLKMYLEYNLPQITTNVIEFSKEINKAESGLIIDYGDYKGLVNSINKIINNYETYSKNVLKLNKKYYYKNIYPQLFDFDQKTK